MVKSINKGGNMNLIEALELTLKNKKIRKRDWKNNHFICSILEYGLYDENYMEYKLIISCYNDLFEDEWEEYIEQNKQSRQKVSFLEALKFIKLGGKAVRENHTAIINSDFIYLDNLSIEDIEATDWLIIS